MGRLPGFELEYGKIGWNPNDEPVPDSVFFIAEAESWSPD